MADGIETDRSEGGLIGIFVDGELVDVRNENYAPRGAGPSYPPGGVVPAGYNLYEDYDRTYQTGRDAEEDWRFRIGLTEQQRQFELPYLEGQRQFVLGHQFDVRQYDQNFAEDLRRYNRNSPSSSASSTFSTACAPACHGSSSTGASAPTSGTSARTCAGSWSWASPSPPASSA